MGRDVGVGVDRTGEGIVDLDQQSHLARIQGIDELGTHGIDILDCRSCPRTEIVPVPFCRTFFQWYNTQHRHGGVGLLTPRQVHLGRAPEVIEHRQNVLAAAYAARPDRFVGGPPKATELPAEVWINRALPVTSANGAEPANGGKEGSLN